jgi:hypothetical protein
LILNRTWINDVMMESMAGLEFRLGINGLSGSRVYRGDGRDLFL